MMLSSKGSVGACTPTGISAFLLCAFTAHNHDMIDEGNAQQLPSVHEPLREGTIFPAGSGVA
jgi:hypothetical protein